MRRLAFGIIPAMFLVPVPGQKHRQGALAVLRIPQTGLGKVAKEWRQGNWTASPASIETGTEGLFNLFGGCGCGCAKAAAPFVHLQQLPSATQLLTQVCANGAHPKYPFRTGAPSSRQTLA